MATYVSIIKDFEDEKKVIYRFGPDDQHMGKVLIIKSTGEYVQLEPVPETSSNFYINKTVLTLLKLLENGATFPDRTHYAS